jgi:HSP20 family molecular chaperone IbpA
MAQLSAGLAQLGTALQHPEGFVQSNRESGSSGVNSGGSASKLVFGYTVRVGQAGISAEPFGNVPQPARKAATPTAARGHTAQEIAPRQPIVDVFEERGVFVIIAELPGTSDSDITCTATGNAVRIETTGAHAYAKDVDLPAAAIPETLVSRCQNGILEVRVQRRDTCT